MEVRTYTDISTFWSRGLKVRSRVNILYLTAEGMILKWETAIIIMLHWFTFHWMLTLRFALCFATWLHGVVDGLISLNEDVASAPRHQDPGRLPAAETAAGRHQIQVGRELSYLSNQFWHPPLVNLFKSKQFNMGQQYLPLGAGEQRSSLIPSAQFHWFPFRDHTWQFSAQKRCRDTHPPDREWPRYSGAFPPFGQVSSHWHPLGTLSGLWWRICM